MFDVLTDTGSSADAYLERGARHRVCEDYAVAGAAPALTYAVLSDGCSSSTHTDVGARLLVHAAVRELIDTTALDLPSVLLRARLTQRSLGLPDESLDATLLVAWGHEHGPVHIVAVGDGALFVRHKGGAEERWLIEEQGAPVYLSYLDSPERQRALLAAGYGLRTVEHARGDLMAPVHSTRGLWRRDKGRLDERAIAFRLELDPREVAQVLLFSDGVSSFERQQGARSEPIPIDDVLHHLTAFKSTAGAFVERRAKRFLRRDCAQRGWSHHDDVSIAGFTVDETHTRGGG